MTKTSYLFPNLEELILFIINTTEKDLTPLRLHKSIYLLFAYYGAFAQLSNKKNHLVDVQFEAWDYGPVVRAIWQNQFHFLNLNGESTVSISDNDNKLLIMILSQIDDISEYSLSARTKADKTFKKAHTASNTTIINNDDLIAEYIDDLKSQSNK